MKGTGFVVFDPVVVTKSDAIEVGEGTRIDSFTKLEGGLGLTIGRHVHIASFCHVNIGGGRTIIEDGAAMASGAKIVSGGNRPSGESCSAVAPAEQQVLEPRVTKLGRNACLYAGAILTAGVTVGEGSRIAAGAVVVGDVPPFEVWGGVPARRLRTLDRPTREITREDVTDEPPSWSPRDVIDAMRSK